MESKTFNLSEQKDTTRDRSSDVKSEGEEKNMISYHAITTDEIMYEQEEKDMVSECDETIQHDKEDEDIVSECVETIQQDKESKEDEKVTSWCEETMSWTDDDDDKTMSWDNFLEMHKKNICS